VGEVPQLCHALGELAVFHYVRTEHRRALEFAEEALSVAQQFGDPLLVALGHWQVGFASFGLGEYTTARGNFRKVISFYEPQEHHQSIVTVRGLDAGVNALSSDACCLWALGYPEQALQRSEEALALARDLDHPFSLADGLCYAGCIFNSMRRDAQALKDDADELVRLSKEMGLRGWGGQGTCYQGQALTGLGQLRAGMTLIREGLAVCYSIGDLCYSSGILGALALAQARAGRPEEGLATLAETLRLVEQTEERHWEAELHRLKGEVLLAQGDETEAEASLLKAIEVARRQSAKSWELRAATSLARLWRTQGREGNALELLSPIYDWFTEGFETRDLLEARALLDELARAA
jgi:predicted ATPase